MSVRRWSEYVIGPRGGGPTGGSNTGCGPWLLLLLIIAAVLVALLF